MVESASGRCTLTATVCPVDRSRALYTCASDADPTGSSDQSLKTSSRGFPSSCSTTARASAVGKVSMRSCRRVSSRMTAGGSTSGLVTGGERTRCKWVGKRLEVVGKRLQQGILGGGCA